MEKEESGKLKAINVTAPGGVSIKPPKRDRKRAPRGKGKGDAASGESEDEAAPANETPAPKEKTEGAAKSNGRKKGGDKGGEKKTPVEKKAPTESKPREPPFHDAIDEEAKASIKAKGVDLGRKMTVDVAFGDSRIKLGQGGYAGLADSSGMVGEGTYTCDEKGLVAFTWERCLSYSDGKWSSGDIGKLIKSLSLANGTSICQLLLQSKVFAIMYHANSCSSYVTFLLQMRLDLSGQMKPPRVFGELRRATRRKLWQRTASR